MCEGGHDLLIVIGEGIIIGVVVVLKGIPEGKGVFALSCEWLGGSPNECGVAAWAMASCAGTGGNGVPDLASMISVNGATGGVLEEEAVGTEGRGRVGDRGSSTGPLDIGGVGT